VDRLLELIVDLPPALVLALVFLLPALEASTFLGIVVPGEVAVLLGGVVAHQGALPLWAVIVAALAGGAVGDQIGYLFGRHYGYRLLQRLPKRIAKPAEVQWALRLVRTRGAVAVFVGRWTAALRALIPGIAGISRMPQAAFTAANVSGGLGWAVAVSVLGYAAGASYRLLEDRLRIGSEVLLGVIFALVAYGIWRHVKRDR
jgi:membrane-associated protein